MEIFHQNYENGKILFLFDRGKLSFPERTNDIWPRIFVGKNETIGTTRIVNIFYHFVHRY